MKAPEFFCYAPRPKGHVALSDLEPLEGAIISQLAEVLGYLKRTGVSVPMMQAMLFCVRGLPAFPDAEVKLALESLETRGLVEQPTSGRWRKVK